MFRSLVSYAPFDTVKAGEWKKELNRLYTSLARYLRQVGDEENAKKMEEYAKMR
jgi:flagellin-specific chaperone FliS